MRGSERERETVLVSVRPAARRIHLEFNLPQRAGEPKSASKSGETKTRGTKISFPTLSHRYCPKISTSHSGAGYTQYNYKIHANKCLVLGFDEVNLLFVCVRFNAALMCSNNLEARKSESLN